MSIENDNGVYCSVNYNGDIPLLKLRGPLRNILLTRQKIVELIRAGYDVTVAYYPDPEMMQFRAQVERYKAACIKKDYDRMRIESASITGVSLGTSNRVIDAINEAVQKSTNTIVNTAPVDMATSMPPVQDFNTGAEVSEYSESLDALANGPDEGLSVAGDDMESLFSNPTTYDTPKPKTTRKPRNKKPKKS